MNGKVYLVGAGPGDPGLITRKGKACIAAADVLVYDYLASPELLRHAAEAAERIYAGKQGGDHTLTQDQINALIVEKALAGKIVTRLKGGDPFIFGRGGEEIEALIAAGISFEIVPGVTSAIAAPAYAGIPLTHRKHASCVTFITGHEDPTKSTSSIQWEALAKTGGTLVFLMGVKNLSHITGQLMAAGMAEDTPAALVRWGTTSSQETVAGTIATIVDNVRSAGLKPPCIIVIGDVVGLRNEMKWFENRPLFGKRIVVTRARHQASDMIRQLTALGAHCLEYPVIRVVPPEDETPMARAIENIAAYDWLIFTSVNGVDRFFTHLFASGRDARVLGGLKTAAIGPATADRMRSYGINADIVPESYRAESVVAAFENQSVTGKKILIPRAAQARPVLPVELGKMGAVVDEVIAYQTVCDGKDAEDLISNLGNRSVDMVTFTSSSTVKNFHALLPAERFRDLTDGVVMAAIGPITADTAAELGIHVDIVAESYTVPGLCDAIVAYYRKERAADPSDYRA